MKSIRSFFNFIHGADMSRSINEGKIGDAFTGEGDGNKRQFQDNTEFSEQVDALITGRWPKISPVLAVSIMRFSKNWKDEIGACRIEEDETLSKFIDKTGRIQAVINERGMTRKRESTGGITLTIDFPGKKQGLLMGAMKANYPNGMKVKFGNGKLTGKFADEKDAVNVFNVAKAILAGEVGKGAKLLVLDGPADLGAAQEEYSKSVSKENGDSKTVLSGDVDAMLYVLTDCSKKQPNPDEWLENTEHKVVFTANSNLLTYDMVWLVDQMAALNRAYGPKRYDIIMKLRETRFGLLFRNYQETILSDEAESMQDDKRSVRLRADSILSKKTFKNIIDESGKTAESVMQKKVEIQPNHIAQRRMKLFEDAEHYGAKILKANGWIVAICRDYAQIHCFGRNKPKVKDGTNEIDQDCNLRDDEMEAKFGKDKKKIAALRAKRDGGGPHVRDGISDDFDRWQFEAVWCVAGNMRNDHGWNPTQPAYWNSAQRSYFLSKSPDEHMPMFAFMEYKTGKLYATNIATYTGAATKIALGKDWYTYDFNTEAQTRSGDGDIVTKMRTDAGFRDLYQRANVESWKEYTDPFTGTKYKAISNPPDPKRLTLGTDDETDQSLNISDNGVITFTSPSEVRNRRDMITQPYVQAIKLDFTGADELFRDWDISNLKRIDCTKVQSTVRMFRGAKLGLHLNLVTTKNVQDMREMFAEATNVQSITGLDTSQTRTICGMFRGIETAMQRKLVLPEFDLGRCTNIEEAFADSPVEKIRFKNTDKITNAKGAVHGCYMLAEFPNLKFNTRVCTANGMGIDATNGETSVPMIFSGCTRLQKHERFDAEVAELKEYYVDSHNRLDKTPEGYGIVRTHDDIYKYCANPLVYRRGIAVRPRDGVADDMFRDVDNLNINVLDLEGVTSARSMFKGASFQHFGHAVKSEGVKDASYMFAETNLKETPEIDLSHADDAEGIFDSCAQLRSFGFADRPNTVFGQLGARAFISAMEYEENVDPIRYIFGEFEENDYTVRALARMGGHERLLRDWLGRSFEGGELNAAKVWAGRRIKADSGTLVILNPTDIEKYWKMKDKFKAELPDIRRYQIAQAEAGFRGFDIDFRGLPVDMTGMKSGAQLFCGAVLRNFAGITGFSDVKSAAQLFKDARIDGDLSIDSAESLAIAPEMFYQTRVSGKTALPPFGKLEDARYMFMNCGDGFGGTIDCGKLNLRSVTEALAMFAFAHVKFADSKFELPAAKEVTRIFEQATFENPALDELSFPAAASVYGAVANSNVKSVGKFSAPNAGDAMLVMGNCGELEYVGTLDLPGARRLAGAFTGCARMQMIADPSVRPDASMNDAFAESGLMTLFGKDGEFLAAFLAADQK